MKNLKQKINLTFEIANYRPSPYYSWLTTDPQKDFNFGHEHPDAGAFIYIPATLG